MFSTEIKIEDDKSVWNITDFSDLHYFCDQSNWVSQKSAYLPYTRRVKIYCFVLLVNIFDVFLVLKHNKTKLCLSTYKLNYSSAGVPDRMCRDAFPLL
jgi:hypothetical protein